MGHSKKKRTKAKGKKETPEVNKEIAEINKDIKTLIQLLGKYHFDHGILELSSLHKIVETNSNSYDVKEIFFNISKAGMKTVPLVENLVISFDSKYTYTTDESTSVDVFSNYNFDLYIKGYNVDTAKNNFFCWHLDKEIKTNGNLIHPYYHLHAGGKNMEGCDVGGLLMIGSPRIPHPPMDVILEIHFVILNFLNTKEYDKEKKILENDDYIQIIKNAQERVLDPYFNSITSDTHEGFNKKNLFPLYV